MADQSTRRIFLCHAREDKEQVADLYHQLKEDGYQPWLDKYDLLPGQDWRREIKSIITDPYNLILVCLSQNSVNKRGVIQQEMRWALNIWEQIPKGGIYLIPVRLEECQVPEELSKLHWVEIYEPDGYRDLTRALDHELKKRPSSVPAVKPPLPPQKTKPVVPIRDTGLHPPQSVRVSPVLKPQPQNGCSRWTFLAIGGVIALIVMILLMRSLIFYRLTPTVKYDFPFDGRQVTVNEPFTVQVTASAAPNATTGEVKRIELRVNGDKVEEAISPENRGQLTLTASFRWTPEASGKYTLEAIAYTSAGLGSSPAKAIITAVDPN